MMAAMAKEIRSADRVSSFAAQGSRHQPGQTVETVEDRAAKDQFLHERAEDDDREYYGRYGQGWAILHPPLQGLHERLLDLRVGRVAKALEYHGAQGVQDRPHEYRHDANR